MSDSKKTLNVIGLYLETTIQNATDAFCDFKNLPYYEPSTDTLHNSDVPFLSESILSSPFNNKNSVLEKGMHLHFIMPRVLTSQLPDLERDGGDIELGFPPVPNRWIISKNGVETWVVESDYLSKSPLPNQNQITTSIPIQPNLESEKGREYKHVIFEKGDEKYYQPFRYMGRVLTKAQYDTQNSVPVSNKWHYYYNQPLNMLGYGHPMFSLYYPNCRSVFGFHDPDGTLADTYSVVGKWDYSNDYFGNDTFLELGKLLFENQNFNSSSQIESDTLKILNHNQSLLNDEYTIAIGNTSIEATSALLADEISDDETVKTCVKKVVTAVDDENNHVAHVEDILEAIQFDGIHQLEVDIDDKFIEARHRKGFSTFDTGKLWELSYRALEKTEIVRLVGTSEEGKTTTQSYNIVSNIPNLKNHLDSISSSIQEINTLQTTLKKNSKQVEDLQEQLFAMWYRYLLCAHPPEGLETTFPNADKVLIQMLKEVCKIYVLNKKTWGSHPNNQTPTHQKIESLIIEFEGQGITFEAISTSIQEEIDQRANELNVLLDSLNEEIKELTSGADEKTRGLDIEFFLKEKSAPRFYKPNEPSILLKRDKKTEGDQSGFYPMFLEWETDFVAVDDPSDGNFAGYAPSYIDNSFIQPSDEPDFKWKENTTFSQGLGIYEGLVPLSNSPKKIMQEILENATSEDSILNEDIKTIVGKALEKLNSYDLIAQKLDGFNDALLQRKKTIQIAIADPLTSPELGDMIELIAYAVGENISIAPDANNDFNPIRGGGMNISRLNLIDSFGRYIDVFDRDDTTSVIASEPLDSANDTHHLFLPPRFTQPIRVDVRWVSANPTDTNVNRLEHIQVENQHALEEATLHEESTPICGWIIPNNLEQTLMIFDNKGNALGSITEKEDKVSFEPPPYDANTIEDIENIHLKNFVKYYTERTVNPIKFFNATFRVINDSIDYISPDAYVDYPEVAIFMNRPIALIRAKINFELMENYAHNQSWSLFEDILNGSTKSYTQNYEKVKIPIRLGDYQQLNDGVIGYWQGGTNDATIDPSDQFFTPISKKYKEDEIDIITFNDNIDIEIQQSLNDAVQYVTMLFDPRGQLNVTTGVAPVKTIDIPDILFKEVLSRIQATFLIAPVLTQRGKVQIPTMKSEGFDWNWLQYTNETTLTEITDAPEITKANFEKGLATIQEGALLHQKDEIWDLLINKEWIVEKAGRYIVQNEFEGLDNETFKPFENAFKYILENYQTTILPVAAQPNYEPREVIEGWLKLMPKTNN